MPAHVPRRSFAKPFIVTFAAASVVACEPKPAVVEPPSHNPPEQNVPPAPSAKSWKLERAADGTCTAQLHEECAAGQTCAQRKPEPYPCPAGVLTYPAGIALEKGESKCKAYWEPAPMQCPPTATCNPPPTQVVDDVPCPNW